jgi:ferric-dicitrate binding protein FerR (iron transport regulator)/tetratricopeptide (TPR) repeat protein
MICEHVLALISARIDGELSPDDEAALEAHLGTCPACAATAEAFELQDAELRHAFDERRHQAGAVAERVADRLPRLDARNRWKRLRRRVRPFAFVVAVAAAIVGLAWFLGVHSNPPAPPRPSGSEPGPDAVLGLTPRPRPAAPPVQALAVGQTLHTRPGERRRAVLPDGSVIYVNQDTTVTLDQARHLNLTSGEVFVEVTPVRDGVGPFLVETPKRGVTAVGTKFAVRAAAEATSVLVTQGAVTASGHDGLIRAGSELSPEGTVSDAPRASYRLDWTRDLMAEADTPLVPGSEFGGGALVAVDASGQQAKLSLRRYHVDVHIEDGFARTTIDQTYFNHANWRLEGTFYFPLPPDASLSRLAMYVDGRLTEGGMVERDYGRQVYEKIVASQRDPALLEWVDGSTFKMRVFPLEARQEKRLILSYTQRLPADYGRMTYRFPAGHSLEMVRDWSFRARVKDGADLTASIPSHPEMRIAKDGNDLLLGAADRNVAVNRDVVLQLVDAAPAAADMARFSSAAADGHRYLMLRYRPHLEEQHEKRVEGRHWVFLFESSGDRDPLLARTQIEIIRSLLDNAEHGDTFAILAAGTNVRTFSSNPQLVTAENVRAGLEFLDKVHLIGALDLGQALSEAEPFLREKETYLVHVGSGVVAMGENREDVLAKSLPQEAHYVGVGVGRRWNRSFMKAAAERSGGFFTQINPDEPVSWRGFELHAALTMPRLLDIQMTDDAGRSLLPFANSITAGEEVCAVLRLDADDAHPPQSVKIRGSLDGQPFERVLPLREVSGDAGYLPRTWAKLEIERLLAEDAGKHREQIIDLSKAMYVMTPFTSLLVLENEKMYRENKVDRGRKDHWAMYNCPEKIDVVYEPDESSPPGTRPTEQKPTEQQVMQTILVRVPPRCLNWPGVANGPGGPVVTALQLFGNAYAVPDLRRGDKAILDRLGDEADKKKVREAELREVDDDLPYSLSELTVPADLLAERGLQAALPPVLSKKPYTPTSRFPVNRPLGRKGASKSQAVESWGWGWNESGDPKPDASADDSPVVLKDGTVRAVSLAPDGRRLLTGKESNGVRLWDTEASPSHIGAITIVGNEVLKQHVLFRQIDPVTARLWAADGPALPDPERVNGEVAPANGRWVPITVTKFDPSAKGKANFVRFAVRYADGIDRLLSGGGEPQLYRRPSFNGDERVFTDLVSYAPGMNSSAADIRAVLEAEAAPRLADLPGPIAPAARKIIDRARAAGWQKLTFTDKDGKPILALTFDGAGRYAYEHTLPSGLKERVVCDGRSLLHLYPDLRVGARRPVSRFHRADLAAVIPWLVPPAEDLAHGAEVTAVDDHIVAVSPRDAAATRGEDGKPLAYVRLVLVFGEDGRLSERRLVLMPKEKTLARETYAGGTVKRFDGQDKELTSLRRELAPAQAPELKPDTSGLVVLPLPFRSRDVVYRKFGFEPNQSLETGDNACHAYLNEADALELFAADFAAENPGNARTIYRNCFAHDLTRAAGFHVLLASCGDRTSPLLDLQKLRSQPGRERDPLLLYLTLLNLPEYRRWQPRLGLDLAGGLCASHPFLGKLAAFRDHWLVWHEWGQVDATLPGNGWLRERQVRAFEFVRTQRGTALAWALLGMLYDATAASDQRLHRELADAWGLFLDRPGFAYPARYERARALLVGGRRDEARAEFRAMFAEAVKRGVLPTVDATFREALQGEEKEADLWTEMMRQTVAEFCKDHRRSAAVVLAWQCWQLGDQPLASNLLTAALDGITDEDERRITTLSAVAFLYQTGQHAAADTRLRSLLDERDLAAQPALWRMAGRIADARGLTARSIECLERALALEYEDLPEVINLEEVRRDYGRLLDHYTALAQAVTAMKIEPPRDLAARTVRAADCWRALDRDEAERPCQAAATILRSLGAADLAWEYQTTPIARRPNESGPWLGLAQTLQREGDFKLADRAYAAAFAAEPTNAQILWDRAQALRQNGKQAEAGKLLRQIVAGDWQPRFAWVRSQARWQLEGR